MQLGNAPAVWTPDERVTSCARCAQPFTLFRRRHHCRVCGNCFCSACCKRRLRDERVCERLFACVSFD